MNRIHLSEANTMHVPHSRQESAFSGTMAGGGAAPFTSPLFGSLGPLAGMTGIGGGSATTDPLAALNQLSQLTALGQLSGLTGMMATQGRHLASDPDMSGWGEMVEVSISSGKDSIGFSGSTVILHVRDDLDCWRPVFIIF